MIRRTMVGNIVFEDGLVARSAAYRTRYAFPTEFSLICDRSKSRVGEF